MAQRRARAAFTVIELMVAVTIIGVMAAAVIPTLSELRADSRQSSAAQELVRLGRRARARAMETGVAHLLRFRSANSVDADDPPRDSNGLGRVELIMGMTHRCRQTPWGGAFAPVQGSNLGVDVSRREGPDVLDMAPFNPIDSGTTPKATDDGRHVVALKAWTGPRNVPGNELAAVQVCYQPGGQSYVKLDAAAATAADDLVPQAGPIIFTITRTVNQEKRGVAREVVFPVGGNARVRQ